MCMWPWHGIAGSLSQHSPTPVSLSRLLNALFFLILISLCGTLDSSYYYQHTQASGLLFLPCNHCGVREMCILEERPVFLWYSDFGAVISIWVRAWARGPVPPSHITSPFSRTRGRGEMPRILYINRETWRRFTGHTCVLRGFIAPILRAFYLHIVSSSTPDVPSTNKPAPLWPYHCSPHIPNVFNYLVML
jgi:hypothetical protein